MTAREGARRPDPELIAWLRSFTASPTRRRCLVAGCGHGDDAEALASAGYEVTAFDTSPAAIEAAGRRFPRSGVAYVVADLLAAPRAWAGQFDLVYDARTLHALDPAARPSAVEALAGFLALGGRLFVLCDSRDVLARFERLGLRTASIEAAADGTRYRAFFDRLEA